MTSSRGIARTFSSSSITTSGCGRRQVDLVEDRDDREALAHGEVDVGQRLGLDALRGVDHEDRALARLEAAADLVGEVDVARRVDEVEAVDAGRRSAVYSRRTARALIVMPFSRSRSIESRTWLVICRRLDGVGHLQQPVGERGLPVIDVRDDREVPQAGLGDGHEAGV